MWHKRGNGATPHGVTPYLHRDYFLMGLPQMLGNFIYSNPTKLYFGDNALSGLREELPKYGKNVLFVYGGGSIKKTGFMTK